MLFQIHEITQPIEGQICNKNTFLDYDYEYKRKVNLTVDRVKNIQNVPFLINDYIVMKFENVNLASETLKNGLYVGSRFHDINNDTLMTLSVQSL